MIIKKFMSTAMLCLALSACTSAQKHRKAVSDDSGDRISVGTVQKEIRVGMSGAEVATVLGSPNIVTSDEERRETWIYDKISTERVYSSSAGGVGSLIFGGAPVGVGVIGGGVEGSYNSEAGAASTTQKTLTVIIKFDKSGRVRDFAYHTSKF
jgi:outer membrane protein assembly factor BamE (lipoprotein component of BamABCDE complex)